VWEGLVQALLEKGKYDVMVKNTVERFGLDAPFKRGKNKNMLQWLFILWTF
jgi:hypothetical protein